MSMLPLTEGPWPDPNFEQNREKFPLEELMKYVGQHIAWNWEGTRIMAADPDLSSLDRRLREAGIDVGHVVHDYVDDPNVGWL